MADFFTTFFNVSVIVKYFSSTVNSVGTTLGIAVAIIIAGIIWGIFLASLRTYHYKIINFFIVCFVDILRALPPVVIIMIFYFGLPYIGITISSWWILFLVLAVTLSAFAEEIFWAGYATLDKGQWEAGTATGLSYLQTIFFIAMPQVIKLGLPQLVNRALAITMMTSLGTIIGFEDILSVATTNASFSSSATPLTMAAIAYLIIFIPFVLMARWLEKKLSPVKH